jgi:hypothetical protein
VNSGQSAEAILAEDLGRGRKQGVLATGPPRRGLGFGKEDTGGPHCESRSPERGSGPACASRRSTRRAADLGRLSPDVEGGRERGRGRGSDADLAPAHA